MSLATATGEGFGGNEAIGPRPALSEELRFLVRQHPRESWPGHARLGALAQFWLQRHAAFRELDEIIRSGDDPILIVDARITGALDGTKIDCDKENVDGGERTLFKLLARSEED